MVVVTCLMPAELKRCCYEAMVVWCGVCIPKMCGWCWGYSIVPVGSQALDMECKLAFLAPEVTPFHFSISWQFS